MRCDEDIYPSPGSLVRVRQKVDESNVRKLPSKVPEDVVASSILACQGNLTNAALMMDISYSRLVTMVDRSPKLVTLCSRAREQIVDQAEEVLKHHLRQNDLKAATFALSTLGKDRGYVQRTDQYREVKTEVTLKEADLSKLSTEDLRQLRKMSETVTTIDEAGDVVDEG